MITVIFLSLSALISHCVVVGWNEVQRGTFQPFNLDDAPLELEVDLPSKMVVTVSLEFRVDDRASNAVINWTIPENRYSVSNCGILFEGDPELFSEEDSKSQSVRWAILKTEEKIQIYGEGKATRTVNRFGASPACVDTWWGGGKSLNYVRVSERDSATTRYRTLKQSMCPPTHPFVYSFGFSCCKTDLIRKDGDIEDTEDTMIKLASIEIKVSCDPGPLKFQHLCCPEERQVECKEPPCTDYVYQDLHNSEQTRNCRHLKFDPYGMTFRGDVGQRSFTERTCIEWDDSPASRGEPFDTDLGLGSHSNCRNPDQDEGGPWCYVLSKTGLTKDTCTVPVCGDDNFTSSDVPVKPTFGTSGAGEEDDLGAPVDPLEEEGTEEAGAETPIRLYHPTLSTEYTFGYHSAGDAIDGNFSTFAFSDAAYSQLEVWFSFDRTATFILDRVVVYTHTAFQDFHWYSNYYQSGVVVELDAGNYCMGEVYTPGVEKYEFYCEGAPSGKLTLTNGLLANYPLVIREVEVYGFEDSTEFGVHQDLPGPPSKSHGKLGTFDLPNSDSQILERFYIPIPGPPSFDPNDSDETEVGGTKVFAEMDMKTKQIKTLHVEVDPDSEKDPFEILVPATVWAPSGQLRGFF